MKKISKISLVAISLVLLVTAGLVISATSQNDKIPPQLEEKLNSRVNPVFDNIKVPLSGVAEYALDRKGLFKQYYDNPVGAVTSSIETESGNIRFNLESGNLPQNEETISVYKSPNSNSQLVVGGANDYRGFYGLISGVSGYYVSSDNGTSILREGGLPRLTGITDDTSLSFNATSLGDPSIDIHQGDGSTYYSSLYLDFNNYASVIGLAKAKPSDLTNLGKSDSQVWNVVKVRADYNQFNDKEWVAVDNSGGGKYKGNVYITWTAFNFDGAKIWMARCTPKLDCTTIHDGSDPVSGTQSQTQMSKVSVDSEGRVIVTWTEYVFGSNPNPPYYTINLWYRVYTPGGKTTLAGPTIITTLNKPVSFSYASQGNTFRIPANAWSEVANVGGTPKMFVSYFDCRNGQYLYDIPDYRYADTCSNIDSYLTTIDNYQTGNIPGPEIGLETDSTIHSFFPTMSINIPAKTLDIAWMETEPIFKHDLYLAEQQRNLVSPTIITQPTETTYAGDPSADPNFNGYFIGDYFQIKTQPGNPNRTYSHYTANHRFADSQLYTDIFGFSIKLGGNEHDNLLKIKTY